MKFRFDTGPFWVKIVLPDDTELWAPSGSSIIFEAQPDDLIEVYMLEGDEWRPVEMRPARDFPTVA